MASSTYFKSVYEYLLQSDWEWAFKPNNLGTFLDNTMTATVLPSVNVLGMAGGAFVFIMSILGAFENAGQTIYWVEDSIDDWLKSYGKGKYDDYMDDPDSDEAVALENFLTAATWQMTTYVAASFVHDLFLMGIGYVSALLVFIKVCLWTDGTNNLPIRYGWKTMAFSVLQGSITFLAGQTTSYNMKYVMQMLGFTDHSTSSDANYD